MATYAELRELFGNDDIRHRVEVAAIIAAEAIRTEDPGTENHVARVAFAKAAFANPSSVAKQLWMAMLAANAALTVEQITGASDVAIQSVVNTAINVFLEV